jgi:hypothetical protein
MSTVREQAIEAGARAIDNLQAHHGGYPPYTLAGEVFVAVEPIIRADERAATLDALDEQVHIPVVWVKEAEVRERIAQEIEARCPSSHRITGPCVLCVDAARITRGGAQ